MHINFQTSSLTEHSRVKLQHYSKKSKTLQIIKRNTLGIVARSNFNKLKG
jgi:hypothetical protein